MQHYKQPILTIFIIFATAYVLTLIGCAPIGGYNSSASTAEDEVSAKANLDLVEVNPDLMRECSLEEYSNLVAFSNSLDTAVEAIRISGGAKQDDTIQFALDAMKKCDEAQAYHTINPCKKMQVSETIPATLVLEHAYDGARIHARCVGVEDYLNQYNLRDANNSEIELNAEQAQPMVAVSDELPAEVMNEAVGKPENYDDKKQAASLIVEGANLLFDTRTVANVEIAPGYASGHAAGQCIVSNQSEKSVVYRGEKTLVTEASVFTAAKSEDFQKFVLVTAEGVKLECYGLEYSGAATSKSEVVKLLKQKNTIMGLSYQPN